MSFAIIGGSDGGIAVSAHGLHASELYTSRQLRWQTWCFVCFTMVIVESDAGGSSRSERIETIPIVSAMEIAGDESKKDPPPFPMTPLFTQKDLGLLSDLELTFSKTELWLIQVRFSSHDEHLPLSLRSLIPFFLLGSLFGTQTHTHTHFIIFLTKVEQGCHVLNPQVLCT